MLVLYCAEAALAERRMADVMAPRLTHLYAVALIVSASLLWVDRRRLEVRDKGSTPPGASWRGARALVTKTARASPPRPVALERRRQPEVAPPVAART